MNVVTCDLVSCGPSYDAKYDWNGKRLVTACADSVVRVWEQSRLLKELRAHQAPVLSISWGCGRYSGFMASGAADGKVIAWLETRTNEWQIAHQINITGAANVVSFCPEKHGFMLAIAGGDDLGVVTVLSRRDPQSGSVGGQPWQVLSFTSHPGGVTSLSWSPSRSPVTMATGPAVSRGSASAPCRMVTSGNDGCVRVWLCDPKNAQFQKQCDLDVDAASFSGTVTDVAWRPNVGIPCSYVAACTDHGTIGIWSQDMDGQDWKLQSAWNVQGEVRRISWSWNGFVLAASIGDAITVLYRQGSQDVWEKIAGYDA